MYNTTIEANGKPGTQGGGGGSGGSIALDYMSVKGNISSINVNGGSGKSSGGGGRLWLWDHNWHTK